MTNASPVISMRPGIWSSSAITPAQPSRARIPAPSRHPRQARPRTVTSGRRPGPQDPRGRRLPPNHRRGLLHHDRACALGGASGGGHRPVLPPTGRRQRRSSNRHPSRPAASTLIAARTGEAGIPASAAYRLRTWKPGTLSPFPPTATSRTSSATAAGSAGTSASPPLITTPARRSPAGAPGVDNRSPGHRLSDSLRWSGTLNHSSGGMS